MSDYLESVKTARRGTGKTHLLKHLTGQTLTRGGAIKAKCYDCNGMGEVTECDIKTCPLHPFSPYAGKTATASAGGSSESETEESSHVSPEN